MPEKGVQPEWLKGKGGRPKGSPTKFKREAWESLHTQLDALQFDCLGTAVKLIKSRRTPMSEKARLICQILSLQFPKVQAISINKRTESRISVQEIMQNPRIAKQLETLSMEVEGMKADRKLLPAPAVAEGARREVIDAEPID